jgi:hypothetical protein
MPSAIGRLTLAAILALGASPLAAHGDGAGAAPSSQAGAGIVGGAMVPFGHAVAPRSAVIVAPRQRVVVSPAHARNVVVAPQQRVVVAPQRRIVVVPQQHAMMAQEHGMMAHGHRVFVVPGTFLVVPQTPVYYVAAPYTSCIWCDELGCVRQTLDFCATFAGP